jgi:hypothetical protein
MTERETLMAEIAERQARLAELDKEPDYEAWKPLVREIISMYHTTRLADADVAAHILGKPSVRGLIAAFAKAPPDFFAENAKKPLPMTEAEIEALARECAIEVYKARGGKDVVRELSSGRGKGWAAYDGALTAIRETISRHRHTATAAALEPMREALKAHDKNGTAEFANLNMVHILTAAIAKIEGEAR